MSRASTTLYHQQCGGKRRYATKEEAERAFTSYAGTLHVYRCPYAEIGGEHWHRTKQAQGRK